MASGTRLGNPDVWAKSVRFARDAMKTCGLKVARCSAGGSSPTGKREEHGGDVRLLHEAGVVPAAFGKLGYGPQGKATRTNSVGSGASGR